MASKYALLFKTASAEFRAWENLASSEKQKILPILELTRGRRSPKLSRDYKDQGVWPTIEGLYNFAGNLKKCREAFVDCDEVVLDLTREESLSCAEITRLSSPDNGYENWISFLKEEKSFYGDTRIIPTILVNPTGSETPEQYKNDIISQFSALSENFNALAYRAAVLVDSNFLYDLILLKDYANSFIKAGNRFIIELDHEYIRPGSGATHALRSSGIAQKIQGMIPDAEIIIFATSFPKTVDELGDPEHDTFSMEEVSLFENIQKNQANKDRVIYGDYGSINPLRFDMVAQGWRPRIDFPTSKQKIFYYREKRTVDSTKVKSSYKSHYISVAKKVKGDNYFEDIPNSWGVSEIIKAAEGDPSGKAPNFWISVRMEIYILQQLKRLGLSS